MARGFGRGIADLECGEVDGAEGPCCGEVCWGLVAVGGGAAAAEGGGAGATPRPPGDVVAPDVRRRFREARSLVSGGGPTSGIPGTCSWPS